MNLIHKWLVKKILLDKDSDAEIREMAENDLEEIKSKEQEYEKKVKVFLLPKDEADEKNAIVEIRAGTGGLEASLFASDLFNMYQKVSSIYQQRDLLMILHVV